MFKRLYFFLPLLVLTSCGGQSNVDPESGRIGPEVHVSLDDFEKAVEKIVIKKDFPFDTFYVKTTGFHTINGEKIVLDSNTPYLMDEDHYEEYYLNSINFTDNLFMFRIAGNLPDLSNWYTYVQPYQTIEYFTLGDYYKIKTTVLGDFTANTLEFKCDYVFEALFDKRGFIEKLTTKGTFEEKYPAWENKDHIYDITSLYSYR